VSVGARVAAALAQLPFVSRETGAGSFRLAIGRDGAIDLRITDDERWLELDAAFELDAVFELDATDGHDGWCATSAPLLLERGAALAGLARIVLDDARGVPRLRADVPLDLDGDDEAADDALALLLRAAIDGVASAPSPASATLVPLASAARADDESRGLPGSDDLARLCGDAGYAVLARRPTLLAVDLGLDDVAARARLACEPCGVRASVELHVLACAPPPVCTRALALFLLAASAGVRLVRPFATPALACASSGAVVGFEARLGTAPRARLVAHALAALRVAASLAAREATVLARDPEIAATFLALREDQPARERAPRSVNHTGRRAIPEGGQR
jgi:hypothetical protein